MATIDVEIGGFRYALSCRDGEEPHLRAIAAAVDSKANEASRTMGGLGEARQLLFAALLLADELNDMRAAKPAATPAPAAQAEPAEPPTTDPSLAIALERLADRLEALASRVETTPANA
jgi:cell division protein ZapA